MKENLTFALLTPIKVHLNVDGKNDFVEISTLYLQGTNYKHNQRIALLKQAFSNAQTRFGLYMQSLQKSQDQSTTSDTSGSGSLDAKTIKFIIYNTGAECMNLQSFTENFSEILLADICFKDLDMKQKITRSELQQLDSYDSEELMAKYLEAFFIASWIKSF